MTDFESKLKVRTVVAPLTSVAIANGKLLDDVKDIALRELNSTPSCE